MYEWQKQIELIVDDIYKYIQNYNNEALSLDALSNKLGYSKF